MMGYLEDCVLIVMRQRTERINELKSWVRELRDWEILTVPMLDLSV